MQSGCTAHLSHLQRLLLVHHERRGRVLPAAGVRTPAFLLLLLLLLPHVHGVLRGREAVALRLRGVVPADGEPAGGRSCARRSAQQGQLLLIHLLGPRALIVDQGQR